MSIFRSTENKGFHIRFQNGVCVSVQFGAGNYGDNYHAPIDGHERRQRINESSEAELAIWDEFTFVERKSTITGKVHKDHKWITQEFDPEASGDVVGWKDPEYVLRALNWAANYNKP